MKKVGVIDSGRGGLALLSKVYKSVSAEYFYFADLDNLPFGNKTQKQLIEIAENDVSFLVENFGVDTVLLACNTLTVCALPFLKKRFADISFFGTEPPLFQACQYSVSSVVLCATKPTLNRISLDGYPNVIACPMPSLAEMIERECSEWEIYGYVDGCLSKIEQRFDTVALGCTHYSLAKGSFALCYPAVKIFDSIDGASNRFRKQNKQRNSDQNSVVKFVFSDQNKENETKFSKIFQEICKYS